MDSPLPSRSLALAVTRALCVVILGVIPATWDSGHAAQRELAIGFGPRYAVRVAAAADEIDWQGVGLQGFVAYGASDFWTVTAGAAYDIHPRGTDLLHVAAAHFGVTYVVDAITWVPYLTGGFAAVVAKPPDREMGVDFGLRLGVGVDYRRWRGLSVGLEAVYHAYFRRIQDFPAYISVAFRITFYARGG